MLSSVYFTSSTKITEKSVDIFILKMAFSVVMFRSFLSKAANVRRLLEYTVLPQNATEENPENVKFNGS